MTRAFKLLREAGNFLPAACLIAAAALLPTGCGLLTETAKPLVYVDTVAGSDGRLGEPFGVAYRDGFTYVSDGLNGNIMRFAAGGKPEIFASGLDTPSGIAFAPDGRLIVADAGTHTIRSVDEKGTMSVIAGLENRRGSLDGDGSLAAFNAPIGIAVDPKGRIFVADTYNDRIRLIDGRTISTLAGTDRGFADGPAGTARFDTPTGIAVWGGKLVVADTGNRRIRVVEPDGRVWTLSGNGDGELKDGLLSGSSFVQPTAVNVNEDGTIFVADGNAIRQIGGGAVPIVRTISAHERGVADGPAYRARFNRPSGLCFDGSGSLIVADSDNRLVRRVDSERTGREITSAEIAGLRDKPEEFRAAQPARWPYDPPSAKRDIAGTLGEIRGEMRPDNDEVWYHNGLDIAGAYGETARFIRAEKVLRPVAVENFDTLRELIRMPSLGYIHIRLGRRSDGSTFGDERFQFDRGQGDKLAGVRVPRGTKFAAGDPIGTLNPMNHVHLIAGSSGSEMNAMAALELPGLADSRPPVIEQAAIYDQSWNLIETASQNSRIRLSGKYRVVLRAYDQVDGNSERRRLGVYRVGYQIVGPGNAVTEPKWTITFDRLPPSPSLRFVYANGSHSGATGETIFSYIVTNFVDGDEFRENYLDTATLESGTYTLRIMAADYFGNVATKDIGIEVNR